MEHIRDHFQTDHKTVNQVMVANVKIMTSI